MIRTLRYTRNENSPKYSKFVKLQNMYKKKPTNIGSNDDLAFSQLGSALDVATLHQ